MDAASLRQHIITHHTIAAFYRALDQQMKEDQ
jgi:hypothetical protein